VVVRKSGLSEKADVRKSGWSEKADGPDEKVAVMSAIIWWGKHFIWSEIFHLVVPGCSSGWMVATFRPDEVTALGKCGCPENADGSPTRADQMVKISATG